MRKMFLFLMLFITMASFANPVSPRQAQKLAESFYQTSVAGMHRAKQRFVLNLAYTAVNKQKESNFYVFNRGSKENGYIIVAGDDRLPSVLGYVDNGSFNFSHCPENMKAFLDSYSRQIDYLRSHPEIVNRTRLQNFSTSVAPLLGQIAWDQESPYNKKCPQSCPVGCVATAMGQVMYYNQWPEKGTGNHSYTSKDLGVTLSADFANTTYQWDQMLPTLTDNSSSTAINAVSTLLYQVGVSVDMQYNSQGSGASPSLMAPALVNYFNYDKACRLLMRDYYTTDEWEQTVRNELDNKRAILYGGFTANNEGHSFVCDGYNTDGYYHINWGWSGDGNGYFLLSALDPTSQGIGGAASGEGFDYDQNMIVGIQKPIAGSKPVYTLDYESVADTAFTAARRDSVLLSALEVYNDGTTDAAVRFRFNVYDKDNKLVAYSAEMKDTLHAGYGYDTIQVKFAVPDTLSVGSYKAVLAAQIENSDDNGAFKDVRHHIGENYYYVIDVKDKDATYYSKGQSHLSLNGLDINPNPIESGKPVKVTAHLHNDGGEFNGILCYSLTYPTPDDDPNATTFSTNKLFNIKENSNQDVVFTDSMTLAGSDNYKLQVWRKDGNHLYRVGKAITIKVNGEAAGPRLECTRYCEFASGNEAVDKNKMDFVSYIKNLGGDYKGKLACFIFENSGTASKDNILCSLDTVDVTIPSGDSVEVHISGSFPKAETGNSYFAALYDVTADDWVKPMMLSGCDFTVVDDAAKLSPMLYLKKKIAIVNNDLKNFKVQAIVFNAGGEYNGKIKMDIYPKGAYEPLASSEAQPIDIKTGEIDTLTIGMDLSGKLEAGMTYYAEVVYYDNDYQDWNYYSSWLSYDNYPDYADVKFTTPETTGVSAILDNEHNNRIFYRLNGTKAGENRASLIPGIYILQEGKKITKVVVK